MTHRTDRVYLPDSEERCDPQAQPCDRRSMCARYCAALPASGARLADHSITAIQHWGSGQLVCSHVVLLSDPRCVRPKGGSDRRVHPPIGSLA